MSKILLGFLACLMLAVTVWAQAPNFDYGYLITNSEGYVVSGNIYDIPTFGDYDNDGDMDLLVGVFYNGNIWYYQNTAGIGNPPTFAPHTVVVADGSPISVTYG